MRYDPGHEWSVTPAEAIAIQRQFRDRVTLKGGPRSIETVAGIDVGFEDGGRTVRAAAVVLGFPELEPVTEALARVPTAFPYVPGLLSFRELPGVLAALESLTVTPDLLLCDGQGIAHPRRLGIAAHLGVITGFATIGVGKSRLIGRHDDPGPEKGDRAPLMDGEERIGTVLRTRRNVKPLFISPGYRVNQDEAVDWVLACTPRYRLPEPIRAADRLASNR
ncbi:deoxyribonuclease V [Ectothiorhodospiraceae bacterium WFHF3C12]|nr:deoxyribonuclease V [Ectothiorhodospiraceae bacterium WFHF3C12]